MIDMLKTSMLLNRNLFVLVFCIAMIIGFMLALSTLSLNKEKKKKGFKDHQLYGKDKLYDEKLAKYTTDDMEYYANKKFAKKKE